MGSQAYVSQQTGLIPLEGAHKVKSTSWLGAFYGGVLIPTGSIQLGGELGIRLTGLEHKKSHTHASLTPGQAGIEMRSELSHAYNMHAAGRVVFSLAWCAPFLMLGGTWGKFTQKLARWNNGVYRETVTAPKGTFGVLWGAGIEKRVGALSLRLSYDMALYSTLKVTQKSPTYPDHITITQTLDKPKVHSVLVGVSWHF